jgi:large subunit ribosomal protein L29
MKTSEITELTTAEIIERIENSNEELIRLKLNHSVNPLDNPMKIRYARKDIARLNTELRKRQLEKIHDHGK